MAQRRRSRGQFGTASASAAVPSDPSPVLLDLGIFIKKKDQANVRDSAAGRLFLLVFLLCALPSILLVISLLVRL